MPVPPVARLAFAAGVATVLCLLPIGCGSGGGGSNLTPDDQSKVAQEVHTKTQDFYQEKYGKKSKKR